MIYVNEKPIFLVCNNNVYIKKHQCLIELLDESEKGIPYNGAKEHYLLDIDNKELCCYVIKLVEPLVMIPKSKKKL